jgi:eukaryotic-like serine/threonine-protein kinase
MAQTILFDRYRLLEPAGTGGSAEVWRALDQETGDVVAVKRLHPVVFGDEAGRRRLRREFDALRSLDEPHVVRVRDLHIGDREAALVLDFVDGPSLAEALAGQRPGTPALPPERVVAIVTDVASALGAAHAAGIVHRDVTPGNILLAPDGSARLTDFGIAHASGDATAVTATGLLMGTMRYLAPEQLRGGVSTPASDLHGLAAVTYEMLAGRPAYEASTPVALAEAQTRGPEPIPGVSPALDAAVRRALAVEPSERPSNVAAFAGSVAAAIEGDQTQLIANAETALAGGAAAAAVADHVGIASPSRAAELQGPAPVAAAEAEDVEPGAPPVALPTSDPVDRPTTRRRSGHRVPAPLAVLLGLLVAAGAIVAATTPLGDDGGAVRQSTAPAAAATPRPTARPTPTPVPKANPGKGDDEKGKGKGKGNGNGNGDD